MVAEIGKSNTTKRGTKQRSFNLTDEAFEIVVAKAEALGVTNSAALAVILLGTLPSQSQKAFAAEVASRPEGARGIVLPPDSQETFTVTEDKANHYKAGKFTDDEEIDLDD